MYLAAAVKFYDKFPASSAKNKFIHRLTIIYERKPLPPATFFVSSIDCFYTAQNLFIFAVVSLAENVDRTSALVTIEAVSADCSLL